MRFVHYDDDFPVRAVFQIVVAVFDDLVFEVLQNQKHLRIGDQPVLVGEQFLKVETHEVFVRFKVGRAVPKVGISAARFEFGDIVFNDFQARAVVVVARFGKFFVNERGEVVEDRIIVRSKHCEICHGRNPLSLVNLYRQLVQKFQTVGIDTRQDQAVEFFEELQVREKTVPRAVVVLVVKCRYDLKRVEFAVFRGCHVQNLAVQVFRKRQVFAFGIEHKDFCIAGRKVREQRFRRIRFTAARFANDNHVRVDVFGIALEKVHERGQFVLSEQDAVRVVHGVAHERETRRNGRRLYAAGDFHGVVCRKFARKVCVRLPPEHFICRKAEFAYFALNEPLVVRFAFLVVCGDDKGRVEQYLVVVLQPREQGRKRFDVRRLVDDFARFALRLCG